MFCRFAKRITRDSDEKSVTSQICLKRNGIDPELYLNPLEVADGDSAGVGVYVWEDDYTFLRKNLQKESKTVAKTMSSICSVFSPDDLIKQTNLVSLWVGRVVSCFDNELCLDLICVFPTIEKTSSTVPLKKH